MLEEEGDEYDGRLKIVDGRDEDEQCLEVLEVEDDNAWWAKVSALRYGVSLVAEYSFATDNAKSSSTASGNDPE